MSIPGPGGKIAIRLYKPAAADRLPVLVWFYSGSWVKGDLELEDVQMRAIANRSGWMVVAVAYRLAPEHQFPAATDDAYAATAWVAANAQSIGADSSRIVVGGTSAGGNLATLVALRAHSARLALSGLVLVNPALDLTLSTAS